MKAIQKLIRVFKRANGREVRDGQVVIPDNYNKTFVVTVRSSYPVSENRLKDVIQSRFEVTDIQAIREVVITR